MQLSFVRWLALLGASVTLVTAVGCNPACRFRGTINEPEQLSMRRSLLRKAMGDVCKHMMQHNAPLKLVPDAPIAGRFYPNHCSTNESDGLSVAFAGYGVAWTSVTKKTSFVSSGAASFRYDFQVPDSGACDIYAYFRPSRIDATQFQTHRVENPMASVFSTISGLGNDVGRQTLNSKLRDGFTVISRGGSDRDLSLAAGIVPVGRAPWRPYAQDESSSLRTYENDRTAVYPQHRDFLGPIVVEDKHQALYVSASLDGASAVDVMVLGQADGEASLRAYFDAPQTGPLWGTPLAADVLAYGRPLKRSIVVGPGTYYVVFDHSSFAGQVAPLPGQPEDRAAVVSYLVQIGDAP